jgi:ABC-type phosphate transport system ATPase subunit
MRAAINFDSAAVRKAEQDYTQLSLTAEQRAMVEAAARIYTQCLPLTDMAVRGFISFAMRDWQVEHKTDIKDTVEWAPQRQFDVAEEVSVLLARRMARALADQNQKRTLEDAIAKAVALFKDNVHRL